jgi:glutaredoxin
MTSQLVSELHLDVKVDYVTDVSKIVEMGLITSPVLAINGKPVMVGFTPDKEKIKSLLLGAV